MKHIILPILKALKTILTAALILYLVACAAILLLAYLALRFLYLLLWNFHISTVEEAFTFDGRSFRQIIVAWVDIFRDIVLHKKS